MTSALTDDIPNVRIRRFVKSDGKSLQTVKLTFPSKDQFDKATIDGIFSDHWFYQPGDNITKPEFITFFETILSNKSRLIPNLSECVTLQAQNMHFLNSKHPKKNRRSESLHSTKNPPQIMRKLTSVPQGKQINSFLQGSKVLYKQLWNFELSKSVLALWAAKSNVLTTINDFIVWHELYNTIFAQHLWNATQFEIITQMSKMFLALCERSNFSRKQLAENKSSKTNRPKKEVEKLVEN